MSKGTVPTVFRTHFSEIEGRQAICDAHRALVDLDGTPPPLDDVLENHRLLSGKRRAPSLG